MEIESSIRKSRERTTKRDSSGPAKKSKKKEDFDTPWKDVIGVYFKDFMVLCWPEIYGVIDWNRGHKMLDKELSKLAKNAPVGNKVADKLIEVYNKHGEKTWMLIHVEIQANADPNFGERMLIYRYRLRELHGKSVVSLAILIDTNTQWRPTHYKETVYGTSLEIHFSIIKLIDYKARMQELKASRNPFASVILAHLASLVKQAPDARLNSKIALTRRLYTQGLKKEDILNLYSFLDWVISLPAPLEIKYNQAVKGIEEEQRVAYITTAERIGIQTGIEQGIRQGVQQGMLKGETTLLMRQLQRKFKTIPESYLRQIEQANEETLLIWGERVLDSQTLEEVFKA